MAAPKGNTNAAKAKRWESSLTRALARLAAGAGVEAGLDIVAEKLVSAAAAGERWAIEELGNRMDGKAAQSVTIGGDEENPLRTVNTIELVDLGSGSPTAET